LLKHWHLLIVLFSLLGQGVPVQTDWKSELRLSLRTASQLVEGGWIPAEEQARYESLLARFPILIPPYYAALIDRADPHCPIRRQALPNLEEAKNFPENFADPLGDLAHRPAPRITHRYRNRALLHLTPLCSMNCRYCFRKSLLNENRDVFFDGEISQALEYLRQTPEIEEIIFSGGDPFLANESTLRSALQAIRLIPTIRRVRFHSRVPVTLPIRVDAAFAELLKEHAKQSVVVTHFNHPKELTPVAVQALSTLRTSGHLLLNQSVLLSGVNDRAETLASLSEKLFEANALPYYLHHPDKAQGTQHFSVSMERGRKIYAALRTALPGYLVPRYVIDDPSFPYKKEI
jgi:EF-P beta-lysylation protein EpmB